ncbi:hypothetical protein [Micromonospora sp. NPDC047730]
MTPEERREADELAARVARPYALTVLGGALVLLLLMCVAAVFA